MDNIIKTLIDSGLSEKEAKIYTALLELELATVYDIAKQSDLNRSSTYVVLETLKKKGLAGTSPDKPVTQYFASSPDALLHSAKASAKKQEEVKNNIESILPELKAIHKDTKHRPKVRVYEGVEGVKAAYWDLIKTNTKELRAYANPVNLFKYVPNFLEHDKERGRKKIKMYAINPATKNMIDLYKRVQPHPPAEIALIPEEKFKFPSDMGIFGDKVSFISPKDNWGIIIENKEIAEMLRNDFNLAWEEAKRLDKKIRKKYSK